MKIDLTSIDLDAFADLDVWFVTLALLLAVGIVLFVRRDTRRLRVSTPDPFFYPIGDMPNLPPMPSGSILHHIPADASLKFGAGCSSRRIDLITSSARRAAPAGQGSGGDAKPCTGAAAASPSTPSSWRGGRAH